MRISQPRRLLTAVASALVVLVAFVACGGEEDAAAVTSTPTLTVSATSTPTVIATPPSADDVPIEDRIRPRLLELLVGDETPGADVLDAIDIEVMPIPGMGGDLWLAVTTGFGIWQIGDGLTPHLLAIYEQRANDLLVEIAVHPLLSEPTMAMPELLPDVPGREPGVWIAVHGFTGAHSGTFDLLWFDGTTVTAEIAWFSPSPGAAYIEDLDGDGVPEVVLNETDPYVYCYACGVRVWSELILRWVDGEWVPVEIAAVPSDSQLVHDLTEQAALYAQAHLWRRALASVQEAVEAAPANREVMWLQFAIQLNAIPHLEEAGSEPQPLVTTVLAGEYADAAALITALTPAEAFAADGPLFAGTVAEGWEWVTSDFLIAFASAALEVGGPDAAAHLVRAVGYALAEPADWSMAHIDIEAAQALDPSETFYPAAADYLLTRTAGAAG